MKYNLGRVCPIFKGNYVNGTEYKYLDVVYYGGSSFVMVKESAIGQTPSTNSEYWQIVARHGEGGEITPEQLQELTANIYDILVNNGVVFDASYNHTDNNYSDADKAKLEIINPAAQPNVQADWNETDTTSDAYIQNKPSGMVIDSNYVHTDNNFSNTYRDKLINIPANAEQNVQADWNVTATDNDAYIKNKPTIPTRTSQLTNDSLFVTKTTQNLDNYTLTSNLSSVALTGNYNDLSSKPTIPTVNNKTITIARNGETVDTFTTNQSTNKTINIVVPEPTEETITQTTYTFTPVGNKIYKFTNAVVDLTIQNPMLDSNYEAVLYFTSGEDISVDLNGYNVINDELEFVAGKKYIISLFKNYAVYGDAE